MMEESSMFFRDTQECAFSKLPAIEGHIFENGLSALHVIDEESETHLQVTYSSVGFRFFSLTVMGTISPTGNKTLSLKQVDMPVSSESKQQLDILNQEIKQMEKEVICLQLKRQDMQKTVQYEAEFIAALILQDEFQVLSFKILGKDRLTYRVESATRERVRFEGMRITEVFLHNLRKQMIVAAEDFSDNSQKIVFVDLQKNDSQLNQMKGSSGNDKNRKIIISLDKKQEQLVGGIGVSREFCMVRCITRMERDTRRIFVTTFQLNGGEQNQFDWQVLTNKKPISTLLSENNVLASQNTYQTGCNFNNNDFNQFNNHNGLQQNKIHRKLSQNLNGESHIDVLFSQNGSYVCVTDGMNIEVQDFNNHTVKNVIKEQFNPIRVNQESKQMYNLDKQTLLVANSQMNGGIAVYSLDNPISVLELIDIPSSVSRIWVSHGSNRVQTPSSANYLLDIEQTPSNILVLVKLTNSNSILPILFHKELLDLKLPELRNVSSQITNYNYQDDSLSLHFSTEDKGSYLDSYKTFEGFKTPDRKSSIHLLNSFDHQSKQLLSFQKQHTYQLKSNISHTILFLFFEFKLSNFKFLKYNKNNIY